MTPTDSTVARITHNLGVLVYSSRTSALLIGRESTRESNVVLRFLNNSRSIQQPQQRHQQEQNRHTYQRQRITMTSEPSRLDTSFNSRASWARSTTPTVEGSASAAIPFDDPAAGVGPPLDGDHDRYAPKEHGPRLLGVLPPDPCIVSRTLLPLVPEKEEKENVVYVASRCPRVGKPHRCTVVVARLMSHLSSQECTSRYKYRLKPRK